MSQPATPSLGKVLVTGATGQVGRMLVARLLQDGQAVSVLTRSADAAARLWRDGTLRVIEADLEQPASLVGVLDGVDTLFHLASYAPRPDEPDLYNAPNHWRVSAIGTGNLVERAAASDIRRMLYVSSIKAIGDAAGARDRPADESIAPSPETLYGRAKLSAERSVLELGRAKGIQASVMRLPMVYGIGDKGNIPRMIRAVAQGRFPPWPRIENHRSAIHVDDAVAAAILIAGRPEAAGEVYFVTDGRSYSTRWMYEQILLSLGKPIPRWTLPLWVLRAAAGAGTAAEHLFRRRMPLTLDGLAKLTGNAWYSAEKLDETLGFTPRHSLADEIPRLTRQMARPGRPAPGHAQPRDRSAGSD